MITGMKIVHLDDDNENLILRWNSSWGWTNVNNIDKSTSQLHLDKIHLWDIVHHWAKIHPRDEIS